MALISQTNTNTINTIQFNESQSQLSSMGVNTPINNEETDSIQLNTEAVDQEYCVNSPTRISSTNDMMRLDKIVQEPNVHDSIRHLDNGIINGSSNNVLRKDGNGVDGFVFSDKLISKIIEKAEFGRVVMGIDDI